MQDLPFLRPEISKFSKGECPRNKVIIVLEDVITRAHNSIFFLGQIFLGADPERWAVYVDFGIFEYQL